MVRGTRRRWAALEGTALILALLVWAAPARALVRGPDAVGYTATDAMAYSFIDIAGASGGTKVLAGIDDGVVPLKLPFVFTFYNLAYQTVCVSSNGAIYFVPAAQDCSNVNDFANVDLGAGTPNDWPAVFPLWSDLTFEMPGAGSVVYQTLGTVVGSRRFVVQWNNVYPQGSTTPVTFQAVFAEGTNTILFQYRNVVLGAGNASTSGSEATVGIRNAGGAAHNEQIEWSFDAPVLHDDMAILFSSDHTPPVTTAHVSGTSGSGGWYRGPVTMSLSATDPDSPVASTSYAIDGGAPQLYSAPFVVSGDGVHHVSFSSSDPSNNAEAPQQVDVRIDASAPAIIVGSTPAVLWPPNGKTVTVTASGTVSDATSGIDPRSVSFSVTDSYGQVQPSGPLIIGASGAYVVQMPLVAQRNGGDRAGRTYTIVIHASDLAGNSGTASVVVTVPHDQR